MHLIHIRDTFFTKNRLVYAKRITAYYTRDGIRYMDYKDEMNNKQTVAFNDVLGIQFDTNKPKLMCESQ